MNPKQHPDNLEGSVSNNRLTVGVTVLTSIAATVESDSAMFSSVQTLNLLKLVSPSSKFQVIWKQGIKSLFSTKIIGLMAVVIPSDWESKKL
jgi:hypothetical protein